ncbi:MULTISPECIES: hypothetical protein [Paenibacillus]|uniref:Uncharacterized protein n=2 Tax=Paenibacillus lactis TaxID=228574 RepID=G4HMJ7_9BACL|nr:hypothetical protein [Paenibacillus lactis]EHB54407.1 hypothetical protein PaelaDRAFT_5156 [Paenibacillus lactis 154]MBP1892487.1 hypothetical protein [Paenibacillus lactis]MCM3493227.1 hypothetical protein [Paenibacillus lactis]GIO93230.1 hypothetical protein J31TS3_44570 [Paenibacillus lactis]
MSMDKERSSGSTEQKLDRPKTDLDIHKLMIQLGIHPEKWLQAKERQQGQ